MGIKIYISFLRTLNNKVPYIRLPVKRSPLELQRKQFVEQPKIEAELIHYPGTCKELAILDMGKEKELASI